MCALIPCVQALGDVDELNSWLGIAREHITPINPQLAEQVRLGWLGANSCTCYRRAGAHTFSVTVQCAWVTRLRTCAADIPYLYLYVLPTVSHHPVPVD